MTNGHTEQSQGRGPDRVAKGVPTGGQFATSARAEADVALAPGDGVSEPTEDDLDFARETLGPEASDADVRDLAEQRLARDAPEHVEPQPAVGSHAWREQVEQAAAELGPIDDPYVPTEGLTVTVIRLPVAASRTPDGKGAPGCYEGAYTLLDSRTGERHVIAYDNLGDVAQKETAALQSLSNQIGRLTVGDLVTTGTQRGVDQQWSSGDADDRYPGRFTGYYADRGEFKMLVTPGSSDSYIAEGFSWTAEHGSAWRFSGSAPDVETAAREACAAADWVLSGQAETDYYNEHGWYDG